MALDKNAELLGGVPVFNGLPPEKLSAITAKGRKAFFEAGATIVKRHAKGQTAYLILSGEAMTRPPRGMALKPERLEPGVLVGEMPMLTETVYGLDVLAMERVRALGINRDDLFALMETDPSIAQHLADKITERLIFLARDLREVDLRFAMVEASLDGMIASMR
jgi:CRP/FNR family transcriptional regulator, cyclic AMP receptor protein